MINITVCTITMDNDSELFKTLNSIEYQSQMPSSVVVKDGVLRNRPLFLSNFSFYINYISLDDSGIYDAMNQAWQATDNSYLLFLNSGDVFHTAHSIERLHISIPRSNFPDLYLACWSHQNTISLFEPSLSPLYFSHQSVVYKKKLHRDLGPYMTIKDFHSADYLFFMQVVMNPSYRCFLDPSLCLSSIDPFGTSDSLKTRLFVSCIRVIGGQENRLVLVLYSVFHPLYHRLRLIVFQLCSLLRL